MSTVESPTIRGAIVRMIDAIRWPETEAFLAVGSFGLFSALALLLIYNRIPPENEKYVLIMLGALIGIVKDTFARYFSSTKGASEQRKDLMGVIATQADTATALAASNQGTK